MTVSPKSSSPDPKTLWKGQDMTPQILTPQMLESRSHRLDQRIRSRNRWEYGVGALGIAGSALIAFWLLGDGIDDLPDLLVGGGFIVLALGAVFALLQLRWRTGGASPMDGAQASRTGYRAELVRQRNALRSVFSWYIAPFLPGFVLIYGATLFDPSAALWAVLLPALVTLAFLIWIVRANRRAADCIDEEIKTLDREG
jgi:hypothetical protein